MKRKCKPYFAFLLAIIVSILSISVFASGNGDLIVYITATGGRYHSDGCGSLSRSKYEITLEEAIIEGYTPCNRCNPPIYTGDAVPYETREVHSGGSSQSSSGRSERNVSVHSVPEYSVTEKTPAYAQSEQKKRGLDAGAIFGLAVIGIVVVIPLLVNLFFRIQEAVENLPSVQKRKKQRLAEEQRRKEIEEKAERQVAASKLFAGSDNKRKIFLSELFALTEKCAEIDVPEKSNLYALKCKLSNLLNKNNAYIKGSLVCRFGGEHFGNDCTVYYSPGGSRYHLASCPYCGEYYNHILCPPHGYLPCSKCRPDKKDLSWMYEIRETQQEILDIEDSYAVYAQCKSEMILDLRAKCQKLQSKIFVLGGETVRFMDHPLNK